MNLQEMEKALLSLRYLMTLLEERIRNIEQRLEAEENYRYEQRERGNE